MRYFFYENADTITYVLPYPHCFVICMKNSGGARGVAVADQWPFATSIFVNRMHETWSGWSQVAGPVSVSGNTLNFSL